MLYSPTHEFFFFFRFLLLQHQQYKLFSFQQRHVMPLQLLHQPTSLPLHVLLTQLVAMPKGPFVSFPFATKEELIMNVQERITESHGVQQQQTMTMISYGVSVQVNGIFLYWTMQSLIIKLRG